MQKSAHLFGCHQTSKLQMTLSSKMQQRGATLSIRLMSVAPCSFIILLKAVHLMLTLRAAMKERCGIYLWLLPDLSALTGSLPKTHHRTI